MGECHSKGSKTYKSSGRGSGGAVKNNKVPQTEGEIHGSEKYGFITDKGIRELEELGANRWTKYGKDRLYLRDMFDNESVTGFGYDTYKSGNISYAWIDDKKISNSEAGKILRANSGIYMDLITGQIAGYLDTSDDDLLTVRNRAFDQIKKRTYKER